MPTFNIKKTGILLLAAGVWLPAIQAAEIEIGQQNKAFISNGQKLSTFKIKAGDTIRFKNYDTFFHNVFSLSDIEPFDLGSFPKGDSRAVTFAKKGTIEIECAIHPHMQLKLEVE
jgi:plastocyanin